jgi:hypothetical protein
MIHLVQSRAMSRQRVRELLEMSAIDLKDAAADGLSTPRAFICAYDAALRSAQALAGENDVAVEGRELEILRYAAITLQLGHDIARLGDLQVRRRRAEERHFNEGTTGISTGIAAKALGWATHVRGAVLEWFRAHRPEYEGNT